MTPRNPNIFIIQVRTSSINISLLSGLTEQEPGSNTDNISQAKQHRQYTKHIQLLVYGSKYHILKINTQYI